jgi:hypothetical protein
LTTALDRVRDALGDTSETAPLRSDERIEAALLRAGTTAEAETVNAAAENAAVAAIASSIASEYRNKITSFGESGGVSVNWGDRAARWDKFAADVRTGRLAPIGGGMAMVLGDYRLDLIEPLAAEVA